MAKDNRAKALETTLANLRKRFGDTAIMRLGDPRVLVKLRFANILLPKPKR